jgi:sortase A
LYAKASRLLLVAGCLLIFLGLAYGALIGFVMWRESISPSGSQVLVLKDGRRILLVQPTRSPAAPVPTETLQAAALSESQPVATGIPKLGQSYAVLPPLRIKIPEIGVDWPVVLGDNEHLLRFKGVGWFMGTAFPGEPGNMVLFGHLDGPYSTFLRLRELKPGDEFTVITEEAQHQYRVRSVYETTPDDVAVLAPTDAATATLITCSGKWIPAQRTYDHRLIVTADYIGH